MTERQKLDFSLLKKQCADEISKLDAEILTFQTQLTKNHTANDCYIAVVIAIKRLSIIETQFKVQDSFFDFYKKNSEKAVEQIRREFYEILNALNGFFGKNINQNLGENHKKLHLLIELTPQRLLNLYTKLTKLSNKFYRYCEKSRYSNTSIDIHRDIAIFITNSFDLKKYLIISRDLMHPQLDIIKKSFDMLEQTLNESSARLVNLYHMTRDKRLLSQALSFNNILLKISGFYLPFESYTEELKRRKQSWERFLNNK